VYKEIPAKYSDKLKRLVGKMLNRNADERPTVKEIIMNAYVQERIEKLKQEMKEKEKFMQGQVRNYQKPMAYQRKIYSNKISQNQSVKASRGNSAKPRNFAKNKKPKVFIINNAKKPPKRNIRAQIIGNLVYDTNRNKTPKIDYTKKRKRGHNMLDELMKGKKISEILREGDQGSANVGQINQIQLPEERDFSKLNQMKNDIYNRGSIDKYGTKGKSKLLQRKNQNIQVKRKSLKPKKPKIEVRPTKASAAYQNRNKIKPFHKKRPSSKRKQSKGKYKFIMDNQIPNKKKFIGKLQEEYKKRISAYQNLDSKFKEMENKRREIQREEERGLMTSYFEDDGESMKSFHMEIVQDMDQIISQNDEMVKEMNQKGPICLAKTVRQKESSVVGENKKNKIKKDFGEWFTEDYFEKCLKLEGEFGGEEPGRNENLQEQEQSEAGRNKQIDDIQKDFENKSDDDHVQDSSSSKRIISLNVSSNEKLPLSFSNGYTISNKRNKFGRKLKRILEIRSRQWGRNISERNEFKYQSRINFDENSGSVRLTVFFNRLRIALSRMKQKEESEGSWEIQKRSKSCVIRWDLKNVKRGSTKEDRLRGVYLNKKMGRNNSCVKELKKNQKTIDNSDGRVFIWLIQEIGFPSLQVYLNYHNKVLKVMKEYLLEKWNKEIEELNSQTNLKKMVNQKKSNKKKPKIFQQNENKKPKIEKKYVVRKQTRKSLNLNRLLFKPNIRKSSGELHTHVIQEQRNVMLVQHQSNKTSKPQEIKFKFKLKTPEMQQNISDIPNNNQRNNTNQNTSSNQENTQLSVYEPSRLENTESDIREAKSIKPQIAYNTQQELDLLNEFYEEQERAAESEIKSMIRRKSGTLINDFTQVKDPFKPMTKLEHSDTFEDHPYDLQIQNVVMSEEELGGDEDTQTNEDIELEELTREPTGMLGGILDIDLTNKSKNSFQPLMKLLGIRKPKYMKGQKQFTTETLDDKKSQQIMESKSRSVSQSKCYQKKREIGKKIPREKKIITLENLAPKKDKSIEKISRKIHRIQNKKFEEKVMIEHNKFHKIPIPTTQLKKTSGTKIKNNTTKKNYLTKNKKNVGKKKNIQYKTFLGGKKSKNLFESPEKKYPQRNISSSIDKHIRPDRWIRERNQRKMIRKDSRDQFYKEISNSIDKISCKINSVDKTSEDFYSNLQKFNKMENKKKSNKKRSTGRKGSRDSRARLQNSEVGRFYRQQVTQDSFEKAKMNKTHQIPSDYLDVKKPSFNTGKLQSFLANFNIMDNMEKSMLNNTYEEIKESESVPENKPKFKKMSTQPIYKPSLNNKKLNYLTSNARKPNHKSKNSSKNRNNHHPPKPKSFATASNQYHPKKEPEKEEFLQSGIPLSVSQCETSEHWKTGANHLEQDNDYNEIDDQELENLRSNFNSYPSRYSSNKSNNPWNPIIEVKMEKKEDHNANGPPSNVKANLLRNRKKKLMKRLTKKVDKNLIERFLNEVFDKFKKEEFVDQEDVEKINQKFFKHFDKNQKRLMPSIYQLIDVEIAIQSKELSLNS
jgi:hypothetical protein